MRLIGTCLLVIGVVLAISGALSFRERGPIVEGQIERTTGERGPFPISAAAGTVIAIAGAAVLWRYRGGRAAAEGPF